MRGARADPLFLGCSGLFGSLDRHDLKSVYHMRPLMQNYRRFHLTKYQNCGTIILIQVIGAGWPVRASEKTPLTTETRAQGTVSHRQVKLGVRAFSFCFSDVMLPMVAIAKHCI